MQALDKKILQVEAAADTLKNLKVDVDSTIDRVEVNVKNELFAELNEGGGSFWGSLFGGIAGGALGAAGSALVGALQTTQSTIKDAVADVATETMKSGLEKATEGITKNLTGKFDALSAFQRAGDAAQRMIQTKITMMAQQIHDKFDTINNIASTIDHVVDWTDDDGNSLDFKDGIKNLNYRKHILSNRVHTQSRYA